MPVRLSSSRLFSSLLVSMALGAVGVPACAAPSTFHVSGNVASASFPDYHLDAGVAPGDAISGEFTYDPAAGSLQSAPSSFDFTVGKLRFRSGPAGVRVTSGLATGPYGASFALQNGGLGSTLSSDSRLIDVFTLLQLHNGSGTLNLSGLAEGGRGAAESFRMGGEVSLAPAAALVPEPGSFLLLLPGLAALTLLRRRNDTLPG